MEIQTSVFQMKTNFLLKIILYRSFLLKKKLSFKTAISITIVHFLSKIKNFQNLKNSILTALLKKRGEHAW